MTDLTARCLDTTPCAFEVVCNSDAHKTTVEQTHLQRRHGAPEPTTDAICDDLWQRHDNQRALIVAAIEAVARLNGGQVDMNAVRECLATEQVVPQLVGAVVNVLLRQGRLIEDGWTTNTDKAGRNAGRPQRLYRLVPQHDRSVGA